jgi:UDP-N-acetylglucosamine 4,6-dehydratase
VLALSTDKACAPLGVYGASKLMMEKLIVQGNNYAGGRTRLSCVRWGNCLSSRGSMIPIFEDLARNGQPIRVTSAEATRFLLPLTDEGYTAETRPLWSAVRFALWALSVMRGGETFIPKLPAARVIDVARAVAPDSEIIITGLGPFEKLHEAMLSPDESRSAVDLGPAYALLPAQHEWTADLGVTGAVLPVGFAYTSDQAAVPVEYRRTA